MDEKNKELYHHGILGMKWGVRRYQNYDGSLTSAGHRRKQKNDKLNDRLENSRKRSLFEDENTLRERVKSNQREAANRIKFYGGKNAASNAIRQEARYKSKVEIGKGAVKGALSVIGGVGVGTIAQASIGSGAAAILVAGGGVGAVAAAGLAASAVATINSRAKEQIAYTKDSTAGKDIVVSKVDD